MPFLFIKNLFQRVKFILFSQKILDLKNPQKTFLVGFFRCFFGFFGWVFYCQPCLYVIRNLHVRYIDRWRLIFFVWIRQRQMSVWCWPTDWPRGPGRRGGGQGKLGRSAGQGKYLPSFFSESSYTHTHLSPTHSHSYTRCIHSRWVTHTILTWGMIHQLLRRVYADSPLCDSCVFTPLNGYQLVLVRLLSVLWIRLGFNADPDPVPDPFSFRIRILGFDDQKVVKFYHLEK